jgi:hypothetical protein
MAVTNTLAYYDTATITAVKSFIAQASGLAMYKCFQRGHDPTNLEAQGDPGGRDAVQTDPARTGLHKNVAGRHATGNKH